MIFERRKIMNLGKKLLKIRKDNKMSQEEFAEILYVTRQTISSWENSKSYPDIKTLIKISDKFNISLDILLKDDKKMVDKMDTQIKSSKKFKLLTILLVCFLIIISGFIAINKYIEKETDKKNNIRYEQIITNINKLGFDNDEIGFASIIENDIIYKVYIKKPQILDEEISASSMMFTNDESIIATYDGKDIKVSYLNENNTLVYCKKNGELENNIQNKNNIAIYNKYKDRTVSIVIRMVELFENIYK